MVVASTLCLQTSHRTVDSQGVTLKAAHPRFPQYRSAEFAASGDQEQMAELDGNPVPYRDEHIGIRLRRHNARGAEHSGVLVPAFAWSKRTAVGEKSASALPCLHGPQLYPEAAVRAVH